jgi:CubicO group peptidase (beta-lactamase class C family)
MGHISGLPDFESAFSYGVYRETPTDERFLQRLLSLPIASPPGEKWSYSNTNYWLLARVIERVSGIAYAQFMQDHVFAPLGMKSTLEGGEARPGARTSAPTRRFGRNTEVR